MRQAEAGKISYEEADCISYNNLISAIKLHKDVLE